MKINYGLIAVFPDPSKKEEELDILHFCGYESEPGKNEIESLYEELKTDDEFGLIEIADKLVIILAPQDIVDYYKNIVANNSENEEKYS